MEGKNQIKLISSDKRQLPPVLGRPEKAIEGSYIVRNRAFIGKPYLIVCPECQKPMIVKASSIKPHKVVCKNCGITIWYMGKERPSVATPQSEDPQLSKQAEPQEEVKQEAVHTQKYRINHSKGSPVTNGESRQEPRKDRGGDTQKYGIPNAKIVWGGIFSRKSYDITRAGEHYIGRNDDEIKSDIMVDDEYVSRRSISINVIPKARDCDYQLTVKHATNPVLVNGVEKRVGESIYLNYGDTILVGNTTLTFKKRTK